jgi:cobalt-zinc-cadmium efflux system outer membrane protein
VVSKLRTDLYGAFQELLHATSELDALDGDIVPDAAEALRLAEEGFGLGRHSFLELLDAQRTFVEVGAQRIEAARQLWRLRARLARLTGGRS